MKYNSFIKKYLLLLPFALLIGCDGFLAVNETPNNPLAVPPSVLLPSALAGSAFANGNDLNRFASTVMDYTYGAAGGPAAWDAYITDGTNFGNQWRFEIYGGALTTYERLIEAAEKTGSKSYVGISKIMKAYVFGIATDTWGDVPYSQALQGEKFANPRLDSQEDIYKGNATLGIKSIFDLIREGIADLDATSPINPTTEDLVYGGNLTNWKRAGYSLMLKFAMQMSDREPTLATSIINEVMAANLFISTNAQNLAVRFGGSTGSQSPIFTWTYVSLFQNDMMGSTGYLNLLQGLNDPRLPLIYTQPTTPGVYLTYPNGFIGTLGAVASRSKWGTAITGVNGVGPIRLVTAAMVNFILAEAKLRLPGVNIVPTAQSLFQAGITAHMQDMGVAAAAQTTYITAVGTLTGTPTQQLQQIITQKYIANTGNGLEGWNDYRRTGFPNFPEHLNAVGIDGKRPTRCVYINEEVQRNPNFTPIVQSNVKVWWDVN
jgi:hypothetical protein